MRQDEDLFLKDIRFENLKKDFRQRAGAKKREIKRKSRSIRVQREAILRNELEISTIHDQVVNISVDPFSEEDTILRRYGYQFISADPLYELGKPNFDFLIFNPSGKKQIAMFGEAKGTLTNPSAVVTEIKAKGAIVQENLDYVKRKYLKTSDEPFIEYVLSVPTLFSLEAMNAIAESNSDIILWLADLNTMTLKLGQPPRTVATQRKALHHDSNLNRSLSEGVDSATTTYDFFPQSHAALKLRVLLQVFRPERLQGLVVQKKDLGDAVSKQLFYLDVKAREDQISSIINEAEKIDFATRYIDKPALKIKSRYRQYDSLEKDLTDKWVSARINQDMEEKVNKEIRKIQLDILKKQSEEPSITDYVQK